MTEAYGDPRPGGTGGHRSAGGEPGHSQSTGALSQPTLSDALEEGRRRRNQGLRDAEAAAHTGYRRLVERAIQELADLGDPFTIEDVRRIAGDPLGTNPSALGAIMAGASRRGVIRSIGYTETTRPEAHARPVKVWIGGGS